MGRVRWWRAFSAVVVAVAVALILVGVLATRVGTPPVTSTEPDRMPGPAVTVTMGPQRAPLTGEVLPVGVQLDHPAVAIKISDVLPAHPQAGVERADIVFVEPIGDSYTRLAAIFHSDLPERVGPVRSVRPMDAALLGPLAPVFGNTMGAEWVVEYVDAVADLDDLGTLRVAGTGAYEPDNTRPVPDHMFARPHALLELSDFRAAPQPYFDYAGEGEHSSADVAGQPGTEAEVSYGPNWSVTWTYEAESGHYLRRQPWGPHVTVGGSQVSAANVLILEVESTIRKIGTGVGAPVPVLELVGASGPFTALSGGHSVTGTWSKLGVNHRFRLRLDGGGELLLAPGNTWVELPEPAAVTVLP